MKASFITFFSILLSLHSFTGRAQAERLINNDSLLKIYLTQPQFDIDSGAQAIVLYEKGTAGLSIHNFRNRYYQKVKYTVERYIKINSQQALDLADIVVPFSKELTISDLDFQSINIINGQVVREKIKKKDLLKEKLSEDAKVYKFNFPNVKAGTIIYYAYTYTIELGRTIVTEYFPLSWSFQSKYPTLDSRFELIIPYEIDYKAIPKNVTFKRVNTLAEIDSSNNAQYYTVTAKEETYETKNYNDITWVRRNLPGIADDDYIRNSENKMEQLTIYISSYFPNPYYKATKKIHTSWDDANESYFYKNRYLGGWVFHPQDTLSQVLNKLSAGKTDNLDLAKCIYRFVRDSIACTGYSPLNRVWSSRSPKNALIQKKGTVSDMNILLTALLRKSGLRSFPVVLCTSDRGKIDDSYFEPDALNYLVSLLIVNDKYYLLDASSKHLPFGVLKRECYNDFAWLINEKGLPIALSPDSLQDKTICMATITPTAKAGIYQLKMEQKLGNVAAPAMRALLEKDSAAVKKELEQNIQKSEYRMRLKNYSIANKGNPDTSLMITYDLELELDTLNNINYFNPFLKKFFESNPFQETTRKYPVEFGNTFAYQFILKFQLPPNYDLEDYNNPVSVSFNSGAMQYRNSMQYDPATKIYSVNSLLSSKTATIALEDYGELRSFFDRIIMEQNKKIVIRKIK